MLDFIAAYGSCINLIENARLFERNLPRYRFVFRLHGRIFIIACKAWGCPSEKRILGENLGRSIIYSGRFFRVIVFAESFLIFFNFRGIDFSALGFFRCGCRRIKSRQKWRGLWKNCRPTFCRALFFDV